MPKKERPVRSQVTPLRRRRLSLDLSQGDLARELDVAKATISKWETGGGYPEPGMYGKLAKALDLTREEVADLIFGSEPAVAK